MDATQQMRLLSPAHLEQAAQDPDVSQEFYNRCVIRSSLIALPSDVLAYLQGRAPGQLPLPLPSLGIDVGETAVAVGSPLEFMKRAELCLPIRSAPKVKAKREAARRRWEEYKDLRKDGADEARACRGRKMVSRSTNNPRYSSTTSSKFSGSREEEGSLELSNTNARQAASFTGSRFPPEDGKIICNESDNSGESSENTSKQIEADYTVQAGARTPKRDYRRRWRKLKKRPAVEILTLSSPEQTPKRGVKRRR